MKMLKAVLPTVAAVTFAVGVSHADFFYRWSQTAGSNANSDTFTWAEGQAPSTVNDSARGMMAALAKWRDDTSGKLVTAGTSTVYTLATNSVFNTLAAMDGAMVSFRMNVTSGAAPTLNVDGLGAKALNQATTVAVATGALINGAIYSATYVNASNEWIVQGVAGAIPSGTTMLSMSTACPTGWTIQTAITADRGFRLSTTAGGVTGGAVAWASFFNVAGGATTLTTAQIPSHTHTLTSLATGTANEAAGISHSHRAPGDAQFINGGASFVALQAGGTAFFSSNGSTEATNTNHTHTLSGTSDSNVGGGGSHTHPTPNLAYVDVIGCSKN